MAGGRHNGCVATALLHTSTPWTRPRAPHTHTQQGLEALTSAHPHLASLQFDHVVNLGDMVPRLLGSNFTSLHAALRTQLQVG